MAKHRSGKGRHRRTAARKRKATIARVRKLYREQIASLEGKVKAEYDYAERCMRRYEEEHATAQHLSELLIRPWRHLWEHYTGKLRRSKEGR